MEHYRAAFMNAIQDSEFDWHRIDRANTRKTVQIRQKSSDSVTVFEVEGRLDATTANLIQQTVAKVRERGDTRVLLNLKDLQYVSSAGLGTLLSSAKTLRHDGGDLALCELRENVRKVFEVSGFTRILHLFSSEQEAIDAFNEPGAGQAEPPK